MTLREQLTDPNPFEEKEVVEGCPACRQVDTVEILCDEPGCLELASCGTPTPGGYRWTCYEHSKDLWGLKGNIT